MTLLAQVPDRRDEAEASLCNRILPFYRIISMVFNDVANDSRARYRSGTFYNSINLYAEIFFQKYFCGLQNVAENEQIL